MNDNYQAIDTYDSKNSLKQHGTLGMKWGVWNEETRARRLGLRKRKKSNSDVKYYSKNAKKANDIYNTLSDKEKHDLTGNAYDSTVPYFDKKYETQSNYNRAAVFSLITQVKDVPVSLLDVYDKGDYGMVSIAVRNDKKYRGKGYATESVKRALDWFEQNPDILELVWAAHADNVGSQKLAEKMGFEFDEKETDDKVKVYKHRKSHETLLKDGRAEWDKEYTNLTNRKYNNPDMKDYKLGQYATIEEARDAYAEMYAEKKEKRFK